MDPSGYVAIIAAVGGGAIIPELVRGLVGWWSGAHERQLAKSQDWARRAEDAWQQMKHWQAEASSERLRAEAAERDEMFWRDYAARLRLLLIEAGREPPDWPGADRD